jgi:hypothetical protein
MNRFRGYAFLYFGHLIRKTKALALSLHQIGILIDDKAKSGEAHRAALS